MDAPGQEATFSGMLKSVLILFAHPAFEKSRANRALLRGVTRMDGVTLVDLYEEYPDFQIDIEKEQSRLLRHEVIVFQHPLFWYSTPALLKEWQDLVLEYNFAYGGEGVALKGKRFLNVITTGGQESAYSAAGSNRFSVRQMLAPIEQTARLCGMGFEDPMVVYGAAGLSDADLGACADTYAQRIRSLQE